MIQLRGFYRLPFLSTPSGWRATFSYGLTPVSFLDFYPRPPGGGRPLWLSMWGITSARFLSTPSGWRATCNAQSSIAQISTISIHALRVEGDAQQEAQFTRQHNISIHALRVEGDKMPGSFAALHSEFLSTPSGWRATGLMGLTGKNNEISIHALRVEGD